MEDKVNNKSVKFHDLPKNMFPMVYTIIDVDTSETLFEITIEGPSVIKIPGFYPKVCKVKVKFGDGEIEQALSAIKCPICSMVSSNINDIKQGYCGKCYDWTNGERVFIQCVKQHKIRL
jgi:hypothetical protein